MVGGEYGTGKFAKGYDGRPFAFFNCSISE